VIGVRDYISVCLSHSLSVRSTTNLVVVPAEHDILELSNGRNDMTQEEVKSITAQDKDALHVHVMGIDGCMKQMDRFG